MRTVPTMDMDIGRLKDNELMELVASKDGSSMDALGEIYHRYNTDLKVFLIKFAHTNLLTTDDILQLTWLRIAEMDGGNYDYEKGTLKTWLHTIAIRVARTLYLQAKCHKRGGRIKHHPIHKIPGEVGEPSFDMRTGYQLSGPLDVVIAKERCERVMESIQNLPVEFREAIEMVYIEDQSVKKACEHYGITRGTLEYRCAKAKKTMARNLANI